MDANGTRPEALSGPGLQLEVRRQMRAWCELLAQCGRKPDRKRIHRLRVATLRLQAALEFSLSSMDAGSSSAEPMERWVRQAKKLRHALGPVRQSDVSLDKLDRMRGWAEQAHNAPGASSKEYLGAIERIEGIVKRRRKAAAKKLVAVIERRQKRLTGLSKRVEKAPDCFAAKIAVEAAGRIQSEIAAAGAEFPTLDVENLHPFRKRVKKIRYVAEVFAPLDSALARQASMLKRMTGAIGEWHDWQALAEEAARTGRGDAATRSAAEFSRAEAGRSFENARMLCTSTMERLLKGASAQEPRKPVVSIAPAADSFHAGQSLRASKLAG